MFDTRPHLTVENVLSRVNDYTIFKTYCNNFDKIDEKFVSEFRSETVPSAMITSFDGKLWYKDFGTNDKAMTCLSFVMYKFGLTFRECLLKINSDFNLNLYAKEGDYKTKPTEIYKIYKPPKIKDKPLRTTIRIKARPLNKKDLEFWGKFNINESLLRYYCVEPTQWIEVNEVRIPTPSYCYSYFLGIKDDFYYYKIYSPFSKTAKWISNASGIYQGYTQLPESGDILIITKSLKDVMVLASFKLPAIAPQTETIIIDKQLDEELKSRFKLIYILFDTDNQGRIGSKQNVTENGYLPIFVPEESQCKDISDYIACYGVDKTKSLINGLLNL